MPAGRNAPIAGVGAGVADEVDAQPGERAVARRQPSSAYWIWARLWGSDTRSSLRAGDHDTGRSEVAGGGGDRRVLGADPGLAAEAAADLRADRRGSSSRSMLERLGELAVQAVGHLRRRVERQPAVLAGHGGAAVGLHRHDGDALVDVAAAHDDVADALEVERWSSVATSAWLLPWSGKITGAPSAKAASGSTIGSSGS